MKNLLEIQNLNKTYRNFALRDVSFTLPEGCITGFIGPNGAGKTTVLKTILGLTPKDSGVIRFFGRDEDAASRAVRERLGVVFDSGGFYEELSLMEMKSLAAAAYPSWDEQEFGRLLERFSLNPRQKIRTLSKGMRMKYSLALALSHRAELLIMDEPTSGLDPLMQNRFVELLREEKQRGKTILLSSHMFEEVERTCDRVGIIREGRLATVDTIDTLRKRHMRTYTVTLDNPKLARAFARDFGGSASGNKARVTAKQSLESIFLHYYGGKRHD